MVKYGDSGRAYRSQHTLTLASSNRSMPFRFFLSPSPFSTSSSLSQHEKEIKNKLITDSPCFGPLSVGLSKEIIRERMKIVHIADDDHKIFGEARPRVAGRGSRLSGYL